MANDLAGLISAIIGRSQLALRTKTVLPRVINTDYSTDAARPGEVINVNFAEPGTVTDVTPAAVPPTAEDADTTNRPITLNKWRKVHWYLNSDESAKIMASDTWLPPVMSQRLDDLIADINADIFTVYPEIYGYAGTAGTTPFSGSPGSSDVAADLRKVLNTQKCPTSGRVGVIDVDADAAATKLAEFRDADRSGDPDVVMEGEIGRKFGFDWMWDHQVPTHTAGTAGVDSDVIAVDNGAGYAAGIKSMNVDVDAGTSTFVVGDVFSIAGHTTTYTATNADTFDVTGVTLSFEPGLEAAVVDDQVLTFKTTHVVNLGMHRNAIGFASRPVQPDSLGSAIPQNALFVPFVDEVTGLALQLMIMQQYHRVTWELSCLWGKKLIRPAMASRLAG